MSIDDGAKTTTINATRDAPLPLSERAPNVVAKPQQSSNKRKLSEVRHDGSDLDDTITIYQCSANNAKPTILKPRKLINRSALPLAYLSLTTFSGSWDGLPLFSAYIDSLERYADGKEKEEPIVLMAESVKDGRCFAIERVEKKVYALCGLAHWVSLEDLGRKVVKRRRSNAKRSIGETEHNSWWAAATVSMTPTRTVESFPKRRSILQLSIKPRPIVNAEPIPDNGPQGEAPAATPVAISEPLTLSQPVDVRIDGSTNSQPYAISDIRKQYLEALYISRAPLAYFVKGPLSRARAEQQARKAIESKTPSLLEILQSSVIPVKDKGGGAKIDKKYANAVPELIKEIPPGLTAADEDGQLKTAFGDKIKRSKRRKKVNPDGFFPGEEDYIIRWWVDLENTEAEGSANGTQEQRIRAACSRQKPREMQLQVILILEMLALELRASKDCPEPTDNDAEASNPTSQQAVKKNTKPTDHSKVLEVLLEKLQIWETTSQESFDFGKNSSSASATMKEKGKAVSPNSYSLRNFCTEVIMPFYAPRLPDLARSICQKLGAAIPSPAKKQLARSISSSKLVAKPGAPVRTRRPLARVLTEDNAIARKPSPALSRSTTDSSIPVIKQEFEDDTLASASLRRQNLQQAKRYTQREVDLAAEVKATEAKLKRKTAIEQEIKGAIDTLKRPNARMAVREFVEASDQRHTTKSSRSRKPLNPVFNPFATGVQVMATPKARRHRHVRRTTNTQPELYHVPEPEGPESEVVPPSSGPKIPSSSIRPRLAAKASLKRHNTISSTPYKPGTLSSIEATPSRPRTANHLTQPSTRLTSMLEISENEATDIDDLPTASPELPKLKRANTIGPLSSGGPGSFRRPGLPSQTSAKITSKHISCQGTDKCPTSGVGLVAATPAKALIANEVVMESSPPDRAISIERDDVERKTDRPVEEGRERGAEKSIYEALGWDEGVDPL